MLLVQIIKWMLIIGTIWFSFYLYNSENRKLVKLKKHVENKNMLDSFRRSSRRKMLLMLTIFASFIIWMMSYDFVVEEVKKANSVLTSELAEAAKIYENLTESQIRLLQAGDIEATAAEITEFYSEVLTNYYVMNKCDQVGRDDIFIINTAMTREMWLNNVNLNLRQDIINAAKKRFTKDFINYDCSDIYGKYNKIINNYQNYILATREVLKVTF